MLKSPILRDEVFVAGGEPSITYVERNENNTQREFSRAIATPNQIASLSGPTKTGKTVLCKKVLSNRDYVWIYGGEIKEVDGLWNKICSELNIATEIETTHDNTSSIEGKLGFIATAAGSKFSTTTTRKTTTIYSSSAAIDFMIANKIALVIDDFHYLPPETRATFMRNVKGGIFNGLKVILLSVTHRAFDAIKAEHELTGRLMSIALPSWQNSELEKIPTRGFQALTADCPPRIISKLVAESQESPLLMQRFCWEICYDCDIETSKRIGRHRIPDAYDLDGLFTRVSKDAGLPIYQKLVAGPQSRKSRKKRNLKCGEQVDIYQLVLRALSLTGPKAEVSYDELRDSMASLLAEKLPQKNEVTSAIKHLATISRNIGTETVIDWDEDKRAVNLMDPYLRFYLRWQIGH